MKPSKNEAETYDTMTGDCTHFKYTLNIKNPQATAESVNAMIHQILFCQKDEIKEIEKC